MKKLTPESFFNEMRSIVEDSDDVNFIDAVVDYAEKNDIDVEILADLIKKIPAMQSSIHDEAQSLNLVEKTAKLPV